MNEDLIQCWLIDSAQREIVPVTCHNLKDSRRYVDDIQRLVGRPLGPSRFAVLGDLPNHDVVFVDDEWLCRRSGGWFGWPALADHPIANNALVIGKESDDGQSDSVDAASTLDELRAAVHFIMAAEALAWANANENRRAVVVTAIKKATRNRPALIKRKVLSTWGSLFREAGLKEMNVKVAHQSD